MSPSHVCSGCGAPRTAPAGACTYCGAWPPPGAVHLTDDTPEPGPLTPEQRRVEAAARKIIFRAHSGVWWIVTLVGLGIITAGAVFTASSFGPLPALLFVAFGVAWILIARAGHAVARAHRKAFEDQDRESTSQS